MQDEERKNIEEAFFGKPRWIECQVNLLSESEDLPSESSSKSSCESWEIVFPDGKKLQIGNLQDISDFLADCAEVRKDPVNPRVLIARCRSTYHEVAE